MKTLSSVLLLIACIAVALLACSDNPTQPVFPADQSIQSPPSLAKQGIVQYSFIDQPIAPPSGGSLTLRGGVWQARNRRVVEAFVSSDPYMAGTMQHDMSTTIDAVTGEGPVHGSWKITPADTKLTGGGCWEGTYEGYRTGPNQDGTWTLILKAVGHGKGGTIDGWKTASTTNLTVYHSHLGIPEDQAPPYPLPTGWIGKGTGYYIQR